MPINTAEKRKMAAGVVALPQGPGVTPNAGADSGWRLQAGHSYGPQSAAAPAGAVQMLVNGSWVTVPGHFRITI